MSKRKRTDLYRYDIFEKELDDFVAAHGNPSAERSLRKVKWTVLGAAWVDFDMWKPGVDKEQALAWGWEDMVVTFTGYGESSSTGAVIELWTMLGKSKWPAFRKMLNDAIEKTEKRTKKTVPRRYMDEHMKAKVRSPADGFQLPAIIPTFGRRLREWAEENGMDPAETEHQMMQIEELHRMGMLNLKGPDDKPQEPSAATRKKSGPVLTLLPGGAHGA